MRLTLTVLLLFTAGIVHSQSTFLNRPSKTQSASVLEKGVLQLESTYENERTGESGSREQEILFPGIALRYGLGWGMELQWANAYETRKDELGTQRGISDMELGTEIQLVKSADEKIELALMSRIFLPTGQNGISNERLGNETLLLGWHELTHKIGLEYNVGFSHFEDDTEKGDGVYALVVEYEMNDRVGIFFENYGELIEWNELEASIDIGLGYQLSEYFELDLAAGAGINHPMQFMSLGVSWRIGQQTD